METIEEAAEKYSINGEYKFMSSYEQMAKIAFKAGAKWQLEKQWYDITQEKTSR